MLSRLRGLMKQANPKIVEEWKWRGVSVWSHHGLICTGETYKNVVKPTFAKGASLEDPSGLFNSSLAGNRRRAIDSHEGKEIDQEALKVLIRAAVTLNTSRAHASARAFPAILDRRHDSGDAPNHRLVASRAPRRTRDERKREPIGPR